MRHSVELQLLPFSGVDKSSAVCFSSVLALSDTPADINFSVRHSRCSRTCFSSYLIAAMSDSSSGMSGTLDLLAAQNVGRLFHRLFSSTTESILIMSSIDAFILLLPMRRGGATVLRLRGDKFCEGSEQTIF